MKSFFNFLSEARVTKAAEKAKKLGLTSDGQGGWRDRDGNVKARTVAGELSSLAREVLVPKNLLVKEEVLHNQKHNHRPRNLHLRMISAELRQIGRAHV